jgi:hypothetical protein
VRSRLRRLLEAANAVRPRRASEVRLPQGSDRGRDAARRLEAARQRLKQTIGPPEDPDA